MQVWLAVQVGSICLNLGRMTNNQAEYYGLLAGLEAAGTVGIKHLKVLGDSQLVVRQVWSVPFACYICTQGICSNACIFVSVC